MNLPSYPELGLVALNLLSELLTQFGLGQHPPGKKLRKFMAGQD